MYSRKPSVFLTSIPSYSSILSYSNIYNLWKHSSKKIWKKNMLPSWKTDLTTITMLQKFRVFLKSKPSCELNLIPIYFFVIIVWAISYWSNKISNFVPRFFVFFQSIFAFISRKSLFLLLLQCTHLFYW